MKNDYLIMGLILGIIGIVLVVLGPFTCFTTCYIGIPLAIIGLIIFIIAFASNDEQAVSYPKMCMGCGRQIDYYAQICPWCHYDYRYPTYYAPPPQPYPPAICPYCHNYIQPGWISCPGCGNKLK